MTWEEYFKQTGVIDDHDFPHAMMQMKGTDICADIHCKCGESFHFDGDFLYAWECPSCRTKYAINPTIKLVELNDEQSEFISSTHGFKTSDIEGD
jgi:hypothetical protein